MTERSPRHRRLRVAGDPDLITGERLRLSRTIVGNRTQAREALQRLVVEAGAGLHDDSGTTVGVLLEMFMATATLAPSTRADWESVVNRHLLPELGHLPLRKLTARDRDRLYARMAADGAGPLRCKCAHVVLHRVMVQAVRWGWLIRNPVSDATRPEVPRTEINPPSAATFRELLDSARATDEVLHCWLQIAVATGARRGELREGSSGGPISGSCWLSDRQRRRCAHVGVRTTVGPGWHVLRRSTDLGTAHQATPRRNRPPLSPDLHASITRIFCADDSTTEKVRLAHLVLPIVFDPSS